MYDYVIVGAGISGLYAAHLLRNTDTIILDKNSYIGGRVKSTEFHGSTIQLGAGIPRAQDYRVRMLAEELGIPYEIFYSDIKYFDESSEWFNDILNSLTPKKGKTFLQVLEEKYSPSVVKKWISLCDFNDFLDADSFDTLMYYPTRDMLHQPKAHVYLEGGYGNLIEKLAKKVKADIRLNTCVMEIIKEHNDFRVVLDNNTTILTKQVILATDYSGLKIKITPEPKIMKHFRKEIGTNEFLRIYTYHKKMPLKNALLHKKLRLIFPISDNVLLSGYSANEQAQNILKMKDYDAYLQKEFKVSPVEDKIIQYWKIGTHYFKKGYSHNLRHYSKDGLTIVGEMLSHNQGWCEGALESVEEWFWTKIKLI